jgi:hypothetical protein
VQRQPEFRAKAGWLAFQCDAESRRLMPIPSEWRSVSDQKLAQLAKAATPVPGQSRQDLAAHEQLRWSALGVRRIGVKNANAPAESLSFSATRIDSMAQSLRQDPVLLAFRTIADAGASIPPHCLTALDVAVRRTANEMRLAGRPIERVVAHVKSMAADAGIRESHDRLIADAVLWAITYFYGEDKFQPVPSPSRYDRGRIEERVVPLEVGVDSLSWVIEELDRRGAERCERRERHDGLSG